MNTPSGNPVYTAVPQLGRLRDEVLFGDVWEQPELSARDRSLVTCAVLAARGRSDELRVHLRRAVDNGVTVDELRGLVVQVAFYAGWPYGVGAAQAGLELFGGDAGQESR
ncbi:carboxymuconolactone decarboxylase family protein [Saccharomonospora sp. NPDC046836]|uniref:carboxymuconolactone decarboxylase family protein n=1 Tax=Saccharomonospora sp. NPDC046836 TaxID=3156921 RepID=UPI0033F8D845